MEISAENNDSCIAESRSLRKRPSKPPVINKRRKSDVSVPLEGVSIEDLYLQDSSKIENFHPTSLETIYESPKGKNNCLKDIMGVVKLRRQCRFTPFYNPPKNKITQRKRRAKILKRIGVKSFKVKVSLEQVEKALQDISGDENEETRPRIFQTSADSPDWCYENNIIIPDKSLNEIENLTSDLADMNVSNREQTLNHCQNVSFEVLDMPDQTYKPLESSILNDLELLLPSPSKLGKKNRRRSGRVSHLVLDDLDAPHISYTAMTSPCHESSTAASQKSQIDKRINDDNNFATMEVDSFTSNTSPVCQFPAVLNHLTASNRICNVTSDSDAKNLIASQLNKDLNAMPQSPSSGFKGESSSVQKSEISDNSLPKNASKKRKKTARRTSGVRKALYSSSRLNTSANSPETEFFHAVTVTQQIQEPENSVGSYLGNVNIGSPDKGNEDKIMKNKLRRRSARLSCGGMQMGSVWSENCKSPVDNTTLKYGSDSFHILPLDGDTQRSSGTINNGRYTNQSPLRCSEGSESQTHRKEVWWHNDSHQQFSSTSTTLDVKNEVARSCNKSEILDGDQFILSGKTVKDKDTSVSCTSTAVLPQISSQSVETELNNVLLPHDSPVLSGMFDGKARIVNGKKIFLRQSSVSLEFFQASKFDVH